MSCVSSHCDMCPRATVSLSSYCNKCSRTTISVSSMAATLGEGLREGGARRVNFKTMCVLILLYTCPHTAIYEE